MNDSNERIPENLKKISFSNKLRSRGLKNMLLFCAQDTIFEFKWKNIAGICRIESEKYQQSGKWSGTDYEISYLDGIDAFVLKQDWESSLWIPESTWERVLQSWKKHFPWASDEAIECFIRSSFPKNSERLDAAENILQEDPSEYLQKLKEAQQNYQTATKLRDDVVRDVQMLIEAEKLNIESKRIEIDTSMIREKLANSGKRGLSLWELQELYATIHTSL